MQNLTNKLNKQQNSDPDDDSDMDSLDDPQITKPKHVKQLEVAYAANPYSLEIAQELLKIYDQSNETGKLAALRRSLLSVFTLPESLWLDWLEDEMMRAKGDEEKRKVLKLFETALDDLLYFDVAKLYAKYAEGLHKSGIIKKNGVKIVYEKLINFFSGDFDRGAKFFKKYRKFEMESDPEGSVKTVRTLFSRQLKLPLIFLDSTWQAYEEWEKDKSEIPKMQEIYTRTYLEMTKHLDLEGKLNEYLELKDTTALHQFLKDMAANPDFTNEKKINLFERAVEKHLPSHEIWTVYTNFYVEQIPSLLQQEKLLQRAVKNCYWNVNLGVQYLRVLEKLHNEASQIEQEAFKLMKGMSSTVDYYLIWLFLVEVYTRALNTKLRENKHNQENSKREIIQFRSTMQRAIDFFKGDNSGENAAYLDNLGLFWANIETYMLQDKEKMNGVMEEYIHRNGGSYSAWLNYISLEMVVGNATSARSLLKRAVEYTKDNPIGMFNYAVEFERKYGTLEDLEHFEIKIRQKSTQIEEKARKMDEEEVPEERENRGGAKKKRNHEEFKASGGHEATSDNPAKRMKPGVSDKELSERQIFADLRNTLFVKHFPTTFSEEEVKALFPNFEEVKSVRLVKDKKNESKGFAYVDFVSEEAAQTGTQLNGTTVDRQKLFVAFSDPPKKGKQDDKTLFLNNLPFNVTEETIAQSFEAYKDNITEIRIIKENGKPRGFAYMTFDTRDKMKEILDEKPRVVIDGRKILITEAHSTERFEKKFENNVIFVKNINFRVNEDELIEFFKEKNIKVKKVHLVKHKGTNKSKGFGYIELEGYHDVNNAIHMKNPKLRDRVLEIAKSDREITEEKADDMVDENAQAASAQQDRPLPVQRRVEARNAKKNAFSGLVKEVKHHDNAMEEEAPAPTSTPVDQQPSTEKPAETAAPEEKPKGKSNDFFKNMFK